MKDHIKMGQELVKLGRILMGIGIVLSAVLLIASVRDANGSLACAAIIVMTGIVILCKLMEAAGHGIVLLNEQNENSKRMLDLLEKQGLVEKGSQTAGNTVEETVSADAEPEDRQEEDHTAIDTFIEDLQNTFRHESTEGTNYSITKDCTDENRIVITKEVESLASKINHFGENYMDSWQKYKKVQKDLAHSVSGQLQSWGLNDWTVLFEVIDSAIGQRMLIVYQDEIAYDFLNE